MPYDSFGQDSGILFLSCLQLQFVAIASRSAPKGSGMVYRNGELQQSDINLDTTFFQARLGTHPYNRSESRKRVLALGKAADSGLRESSRAHGEP